MGERLTLVGMPRACDGWMIGGRKVRELLLELRRDAVLRWSLYVLAALTIADLLTTGIGIALGAQEGNAVPIFLLGRLSFAGLVLVKLGYCGVAASVLALTARYYLSRTRVPAILCCGITGVFVRHNLLVLAPQLAAQ
jgi:hypothetical protein